MIAYGATTHSRNSVRLLLSLSSHGLPRSTSLPSPPQNDRASRCKMFKNSYRRRSSHTVQPFVRSLQTSADSTQLTQSIPQDPSTPFSVKLHEDSFRAFNTDTPSLEVEVTKDSLLKMYKEMVTVRRMEQSADALYKSKLIRGFCHLAIGQVRPISISLQSVLPLTYHPSLVFCFLGSRCSRSRDFYNQGRFSYHRLPLPSFCCPSWWYSHRCHRRAPRPPNRHV